MMELAIKGADHGKKGRRWLRDLYRYNCYRPEATITTTFMNDGDEKPEGHCLSVEKRVRKLRLTFL
jgi:hypothetical protein